MVRDQHLVQYCGGVPLGVHMDSLVPLSDDSAVLESVATTTAAASVAYAVQLRHQQRQGFCVDWEQTSCKNEHHMVYCTSYIVWSTWRVVGCGRERDGEVWGSGDPRQKGRGEREVYGGVYHGVTV